MRSCNTWFTKVAMRLLEGTAGGKGMDKLFNLSKILGLGSPTGVPLQEYYAQRKDGEQDRFLYNFFMPDHNYYVENQRKFHAGETSVDLGAPYGFLSNSSIGQGSLRVTPLQMARMIGVIARGQSLPQLRMVREYREYENNVNRRGESTSTPVPVVVGQQLTNLPGMERYGNYYLDTIRWAMYQTVNGHSIKQPVGNGKTLNWPPTGTRAQPWRSASSQLKKEYPQYFSQYTFAGKTGTGQHMYVGTPNESTVAWIGGMFPCTTVNQNNIHQQAYIPTPCQGARVAVVAFYEGNPREKPVNGSSHAGPIMSDFLASKAMINHIYNNPHATARPINQNIPRSSLPTDDYREETEKIKP